MRTQQQVYKWLNYLQNTLFPPSCLLCGAPGSEGRDLCAACRDELPRIPHPCRLCGLPLTGEETGMCGGCLQRPPRYDGSTIPFRYAAPLDHLLLGLKFNRRLSNARLLGSMMAEAIAASGMPHPQAILPVPLHPVRLRERGYNQALELARPIAAMLQLPLATGLVARTHATAAQSSLERDARRRNIKGAFSITGALPAQVAIVDDVVTTGSTANELARVLKRGGVERVVVWACARVP